MYELIRSHIARYIDLTEHEFDYFTSLLKHRKIRRKQYLLQAGDVCRYESFVIKGCLRTYTIDEKGNEHIIQFSMEDWWAGDLNSFLTEKISLYNIDALEDAEVLQLDRNSLEKLYKEVPKFERFFRLIIQNAFIASQQRISTTMSEKAEDRYNEFIHKYPRLEQRLTQQLVASYLGIKPETLSRIRSRMASGK